MSDFSGEPILPEQPSPRRQDAFVWRNAWWSFVELFAISSLVFAQPLFDLLNKNASAIFVTRGAGPQQILALTAIVLLGPAVALWLIEEVLQLFVPRFRPTFHALAIGSFLGLLLYIVLTRSTELAAPLKIVIAGLVGVIGAATVLRWRVVRSYLHFLALAPVLFAVLFLTGSGIQPLVFSSGSDAASVTVHTPHQVVMLVFDELPLESLLDGSGHIDAGVYPNFAALANDSTWYRNTTTVAPFTQLAVPAIVSGSYPHAGDTLPVAAQYPHSLFTLLGGSYALNVHEINAEQLCPQELCADAATRKRTGGVNGLLATSRRLWANLVVPKPVDRNNFNTDELADQRALGDEFLASLTKAASRRLDYAHVLFPHQPFRYLPNDQTYEYDKGKLGGLNAAGWDSQTFADAGRQRHLLQLQDADRYLGDIVTRLRSIGAYRDAEIIVTADHGAAFTAGTHMRAPAEEGNYPGILWVPLLVKRPGQTTPAIDDRFSQTIDVLPTLADSLGIDLPWKVDGVSLFGAARPDGPRRFAGLSIRDGFVPPHSAKYRDFDGPAGFARVLAAPRFATGGDPTMRNYGFGEWGAIIGRPVSGIPITVDATLKRIVSNRADYLNVNKAARAAPWARMSGGLNKAGRRLIAVSINGRIAGVVMSMANFVGGDTFKPMLAPQLFRDGPNEVRIFELTGTPQRPGLSEIGAIF